jgi:hypothetical protein
MPSIKGDIPSVFLINDGRAGFDSRAPHFATFRFGIRSLSTFSNRSNWPYWTSRHLQLDYVGGFPQILRRDKENTWPPTGRIFIVL